uniref:Protein kinase domain-containing protein n=1 Tax=Rhabditophanes sp. KR3021 TaxID=114890 RepID=A0AC35U4B1_9BILA
MTHKKSKAINPLKARLDEYLRLEKVGEGTYGIVFKSIHIASGRTVCLKKIRLEQEVEGIPSTSAREIAILKELEHPNVVFLEAVIMEHQRLYLVFEFLDMDLKKYFDQIPEKELMDPKLIQSFMYQMCQGMCYAHQRRVFHRDLKPQNLLVDGKGVLKIADFGLARTIGIPLRAYTHEIVTLWYRAPEIILGVKRYSHGVDNWSVGCIFAEMATKKPLFQGDSEIDQLFRIFKTMGTAVEDNWPGVSQLSNWSPTYPRWARVDLGAKYHKYLGKDGVDLLNDLLVYEPNSRCDMRKALRHPYFNSLDKTRLPAGDWDGELVLKKYD